MPLLFYYFNNENNDMVLGEKDMQNASVYTSIVHFTVCFSFYYTIQVVELDNLLATVC